MIIKSVDLVLLRHKMGKSEKTFFLALGVRQRLPKIVAVYQIWLKNNHGNSQTYTV